MCGRHSAPLSGSTLTTRAIRSQRYTLSNSYKLVRALRLLCRCRPPSTRESHDAGPSSCVSCPQVTLSATHPQVQMDPTRTITNDLLSATLAEAVTQLSFPEFLQRCNLLIAPPPPRPPVPTPPLDAATQTLLHSAASRYASTQLSFSEFLASPSTHDVLCPTCTRPVPSLLLDATVQTPLHSVAAHDATTQLPLTEFFIGCIFTNDPSDRQASPSAHCNAGSASPPQPADTTTLCIPSSASHASDGHVRTMAPRVLLQPPPGLEQYAPPPGLDNDAHLCTPHGASVRELIQKIENHPHRHVLQRELQQSQSFNPFSQESKDMIRDVGNIELCELLDTEPKAQCKVCLSYWDVGIVYCTCGHFLRNGTEENKKFVQYTMDLLSIPNYDIKKGRPHGHRYGKKPGDREYYIANSLKKKCKKYYYLGIHDRSIRDEKFRKKMFDTGRTEEMCRKMDELANEDHTHHLTPEEIRGYRANWWIRSNKVGSDTMPVQHRPDFK